MVTIIDGKGTAATIRNELTERIKNECKRPPRLDVMLVGDYGPSQIYVRNKVKACQQVGIEAHIHRYADNITQKELESSLDALNKDPNVDAILLQLPLPPQLKASRLMDLIEPTKDVDGFHPINRGKLSGGDDTAFVPCTPLGVRELLARYEIPVAGCHVVILGRSNLVGKPLALLLMQSTARGNATVSVIHSHSQNVEELCRSADIIIAAIGKPHFLGSDHVREGAVVIDVGINTLLSTDVEGRRQIVGDVNFAAVQDKCSYITPVPGGVGPMTIAMLLTNVLQAYRLRNA